MAERELKAVMRVVIAALGTIEHRLEKRSRLVHVAPRLSTLSSRCPNDPALADVAALVGLVAELGINFFSLA